MNLPIDIILLIIQLLPIADIRNLLRCDKNFNLLSSNKFIAPLIDVDSFDWENTLNCELLKSYFKHHIIDHVYTFNYIGRRTLSIMEKYTFEIFCFGYIHLFPNRYIHKNNIISNQVCRGRIYFNAAYNNFMNLIKFMTDFKKLYYFPVTLAAILNCNLKILKLLKQHKYNFSDYGWKYSVKVQQLKVLKWAKSNGYILESYIFDYAIKNKYLDILKWACKNNYIDVNTYKQATLNN